MLAGVCEMGRRVVTAVVFVVSFRGSDCCVVLVVCGGRRKSGRQRERDSKCAGCRGLSAVLPGSMGALSDRQDELKDTS
jgi:hypothetical protein